MGEMKVRVTEGEDLSNALVVLGTPTMGLVGAIVAQHLVRALGMRAVGRIESPDFPTVVLVKDGRTRPLVQLFAAPAKCRGLSCARLVVIASELTPEDERAREFARAVLEWARGLSAPMVMVPDGIGHDKDPELAVIGVASTPIARGFLDTIKVDAMKDGALGGLTAAMLEEAERLGVPLVAVLGETHPEHPDARAAAAIVGILARVLPGLPLDPTPLLAEAEEIERMMHEAMDRARRGGDESAPMFG
jgi:uncharacterized protein